VALRSGRKAFSELNIWHDSVLPQDLTKVQDIIMRDSPFREARGADWPDKVKEALAELPVSALNRQCKLA